MRQRLREGALSADRDPVNPPATPRLVPLGDGVRPVAFYIRRTTDNQWYAGTTDRKAQFTSEKRYALRFVSKTDAERRLEGLPPDVIFSVEAG